MSLNELYIYDSNIKKIAVIDNAKSVIWTERFDECGDFEIYIRKNNNLLNQIFKRGSAFYVKHSGSNMVGLIEKYTFETDAEQNRYVVISGRCAVSLLARRIVANQTTKFKGVTIHSLVKQLLEYNIISSPVANRNIANLSFSSSIVNPTGAQPTITGFYFGRNLYECIVELCRTYQYGIAANLSGGKISMHLYQGTQRTGLNGTTPVTFSVEHDNLRELTINYSDIEHMNAALVAPDPATGDIVTTAYAGSGAGIFRKEIYVEVKNEKYADHGTNFENVLRQYGNMELSKYHYAGTIDAEASGATTYEYNKHYKLGDTVKVVTGFGFTAYPRVVEVTACLDDTGYTLTPKLKF